MSSGVKSVNFRFGLVAEQHCRDDSLGIAATRLMDQLRDGASKYGMSPFRRHLECGLEGKTSIVKTGVRQIQGRSTADHGFSQQEVEIQWPWPPPFLLRPVAAGNRLEFEATIEQRSWPSRPVEQGRSI